MIRMRLPAILKGKRVPMCTRKNLGKEVEEIETETLFTVKFFKVNISLCGRRGVSDVSGTIFDAVAGPDLIMKDALQGAPFYDMRKFRTSLRSTGDFICKVDGAM